ncbi:MAG TPA: T9SS type A sorting domain-containing protein [Bacteroides sp.]|nr:T9SS type A sorting domain-containing protein [Bacteroides sp.]
MVRICLIISFISFFMFSETKSQVVLQRCDRTNLWTGSNSLSVDNGDKKEGIASIKFTGSGTIWFAKVFSQVYTGVDETGYLSMWLYVSDPAAFSGSGQIEISSSGEPDTDEYSWDISTLDLTAGWNELVLPISSATKSGSPDLNAINFFRVVQSLSESITAKLDDIRLQKTASPEPSDDPLDIRPVDFHTLDGKVMFGYQGWFLHPDDGSVFAKWKHWGGTMSSPEELTVDMFPDFREYEADELYPTGGFTYKDGRTAKVYSAYTKKTVIRHMKWLRDYGLDGVFLQRFVSSVTGDEKLRRSRDTVTVNVMEGCEKYGRTFVNMWDISGFTPGKMSLIINDWKHLVDDLKITESPTYLHHRGKPLVAIWGFSVRDEFPESDLQILLDFFNSESTAEKYRASVMLGVDHDFHQRSNWLDEMAQADVISPWAVGRFGNDEGQQNFMNKHVLPGQDWCDQNNVDFLPVTWPGFSWHNLKGDTKNKRPRRGGDFFWTQANRVISGNAKSVYIAMFDEVDEATAMFKLAENDDQTPDQGYWLALDADGYDLPSDWYLRCAKLATEIVRGNTDNRTSLGTPPDGIDEFHASPIAARCGANNGSLILEYPLNDTDSLYEFSIDNGVTYPYSSPQGTTGITVDGLAPGVYNVWVRNEDDSHPVDLGPFTIFDAEPFASVSARDVICTETGNIVFLINDLPYAGEVQISIDSGINYIYTSTPGIWKDTISGLPTGDYPVWIRYEDETCPVELAKVTISTSVDSIEVIPMLDGIQISDHSDTLYTCPGSSLILFCFPATSDLVWSITGPNGFSSNSRNLLISNSLTTEMFGNYEISYSSPTGCELYKTFVLLEDSKCEPNSVSYNSQEQPFEFYPNPVNSILYLKGLSGETQVEIYNMLGQKSYSCTVTGSVSEIDLSELPDALYHLKIKNENYMISNTLIKQ